MSGYSAWMIELVDDRGFCGWWRGATEQEDALSAWTNDPNAAIKFLHENDAKRAAVVWGLGIGLPGQIHRITQHEWMENPLR